MLGYVYDVQQSWMANWGQCGIRLRQVLEEHIPEDIGLVQDRCFVSETCLSTDYGRVVSRFQDSSDLIETVMASMFIPGWTDGLKKLFNIWRGHYTLDGGFSNHSPQPPKGSLRHYTVCSSLSWKHVFNPPSGNIQELLCEIESGAELVRKTMG